MIDEKGRLFGKLNIVDLLVILVVFLSLQSWRATLIPVVAGAAASIPARPR